MHSVTFFHQRDQNATQLIQSNQDWDQTSQIKCQRINKMFQQKENYNQKFKQQQVITLSTPNRNSLTCIIAILSLSMFISVFSLIFYLNLPKLPISYDYVLDNWNSSPITKVYLSNNCESKLINYKFEGINEGCDCTNSNFSSSLKIVSSGQCTNHQLSQGCKQVGSIKEETLQSWRYNLNTYTFCANKLSNFTYKQSDCSQDNILIEVCGDITNEDNSLYALCIPKGYSCPIKSISTTQIDSTYTQIDITPFYTSKDTYQFTHLISTQVSQGDGICKKYKQEYYSSSIEYDYPLYVRSKTKCDQSDLDSRFKSLFSSSEDDFLSANGLANQLKILPSYNYNSNNNKYYLKQQNYIPWKQIGKCRSNHMETFLNIRDNLDKINIFWQISIAFNFVVLTIFALLFFLLIKYSLNFKNKNLLILTVLIFLFVKLLMKFTTFVLTVILHTKLNSLNEAFCSDSITNSLINDFFKEWQSSYLTIQILIFISVIILTIVSMIFIKDIFKSLTQPKKEQQNVLIEEESVRQMVDSQKQLENEKKVKNTNSKESNQKIKKKQLLHRSNSDFLGTMICSNGDDLIKELNDMRLLNQKTNQMKQYQYNNEKNIKQTLTQTGQLAYTLSNRINSKQAKQIKQKYQYKKQEKYSKNQVIPIKSIYNPQLYPINDLQRIKYRKSNKQKVLLKRSNTLESILNCSSLFNPIETSDLRKSMHQNEINRKRQNNLIHKDKQKQITQIEQLISTPQQNILNIKTNNDNSKQNQVDRYYYNDQQQPFILNSQSELNTNFSTPRILQSNQDKKVSQQQLEQVKEDKIMQNINILLTLLNDDTQKEVKIKSDSQNQSIQKQIENDDTTTFQKHINSIQNLIDGQNKDNTHLQSSITQKISKQNIQNYIDKNASRQTYLNEQKVSLDKKSLYNKTTINLIEINQLLQPHIDILSQFQKQTNQSQTIHINSEDNLPQLQVKSQVVLKNHSQNDSGIDQSDVVKEINSQKSNKNTRFNSNTTQFNKIENQEYQNQSQNISNSFNKSSQNTNNQSKNNKDQLQKVGSLDNFDNDFEKQQSERSKAMDYKRTKFYKRSIKVPKFEKPDFNKVKARYLDQSPLSINKLDLLESDSKSKLNSPTARRTKSKLKSLNIIKTRNFGSQIIDSPTSTTANLQGNNQDDISNQVSTQVTIQLRKVQIDDDQNILKVSPINQSDKINQETQFKDEFFIQNKKQLEYQFKSPDKQLSNQQLLNKQEKDEQQNKQNTFSILNQFKSNNVSQKAQEFNNQIPLLINSSEQNKLTKINEDQQLDKNESQYHYNGLQQDKILNSQMKRNRPQNKGSNQEMNLSQGSQLSSIQLPSLKKLKVVGYYHNLDEQSQYYGQQK